MTEDEKEKVREMFHAMDFVGQLTAKSIAAALAVLPEDDKKRHDMSVDVVRAAFQLYELAMMMRFAESVSHYVRDIKKDGAPREVVAAVACICNDMADECYKMQDRASILQERVDTFGVTYKGLTEAEIREARLKSMLQMATGVAN
jgi:hypothetical protein